MDDFRLRLHRMSENLDVAFENTVSRLHERTAEMERLIAAGEVDDPEMIRITQATRAVLERYFQAPKQL
jgi:hypothetical protein